MTVVLLLVTLAAMVVPPFVSAPLPDSTPRKLVVGVCQHSPSLTAAAAAVRAHLQQHPGSKAEVVLCAGLHSLSRGLVLSSSDSGSASAPVLWRSDGRGTAVLEAGFRISGWRQSNSSSGGLWEAPLPRGVESRQLWVDGRRAVRARSPAGALITGTIGSAGYSNAHCVEENAPPVCAGWGATQPWSCPGSHVGYWHGVSSWTACRDKCCAIPTCTAAMYFAEINQDCYALARSVSNNTCSVTNEAQTAIRDLHPAPRPPPPPPACPSAPLGEWLTAGTEFVYQPAGATWTEPRCVVTSVETLANGSTTIEMAQPCFTVARGKFQGQEVTYPAYVENAKALLTEPGEWWADFAAANPVIFYKPLPGEPISRLDAVLGSVLNGTDGVGSPVGAAAASAAITLLPGAHHIAFQGLMITHLTWLRPSSNYGFVDLNFGFFFVGETAQHANVPHSLHGVPGAMVLHGAHSINITNCSFMHLGSSGIVTDAGSQEIRVEGCEFGDISGCALSLGNVSEPNLAPSVQDRRLTLTDNSMANVSEQPSSFLSCYMM